MRNIWGVAAAGLLCAVPSPAAARQQHQIDLPAGSLQQAVIALGRQARISIAITDPALMRLRVPAVRGRMSADAALRRLLAGKPARAVAVGGGAYRIVAAKAQRPDRGSSRGVPGAPPRAPSPIVDETPIVITASKRRIPLRDYPGSAEIIEGSAFAAGGATAGTDAIAERIPSLGSTHLGPGRDKLFIRAIADSSFTGQTQSTVGQYFGEARVNYNAPDPALRLYDIASVEILPGPQGTLYGAGAMGGVLRIMPARPVLSAAQGSVTASVATTAHGDISTELAGVANLPLAQDKAALRLVGYAVSEGGYIDDIGRGKNDVNRTRIRGGRASTLLDLGRGWSVEANGLLQSIEGRDSQYADRSLPDLQRRTLLAQPFSNDYALGSLTARGTVAGADFISTVGVTRHDLIENFDLSEIRGAPGTFRQRNRPTLAISETRLSHSRAQSSWVAGAQFLRARSRLDRSEGAPGQLTSLLGTRNKVEEQTLFGEYSRRLFASLSVTGGLRLSHVTFRGRAHSDDVPLPPPSDGGSEWRLFPSLAVKFEPVPDLSLFARYQEGFRPGGLIVREEVTQELEPDHIAAWEAGLRFGQRARARFSGALSISYSRWKNVQADTIDTVGLPSTLNIGDGDIVSADGRVTWRPMPALELSFAGTWNRSRVTNPDPGIIFFDKAPLPNVPDLKLRAGTDYRRSLGRLGDLTLSGWANYVGKSTLGIGPILGREQGDFFDLGLEARLGRPGRFLFLRATNLTDSVGNRFALGSVFSIVSEDQITPLRPRTVRLGVHASF